MSTVPFLCITRTDNPFSATEKTKYLIMMKETIKKESKNIEILTESTWGGGTVCFLLLFISCLFQEYDSVPPQSYDKGFKKGMNIFFMNSRNKFESNDFSHTLEELKNIGISTLFLIPYYFGDNESSNDIKETIETISIIQLDSALTMCRKHGIEAILKPHIDLMNDVPRFRLSPKDLTLWCHNYWKQIYPLCSLSVHHSLPYFVVATELDKIIGTAPFSSVIDSVKKIFTKELIYSSSCDHFLKSAIWDNIDILGVNAYYNLDNNSPSNVAVLADAWNHWLTIISHISTQFGKKVFITEVGFYCKDGTTINPGDWKKGGNVSFEKQARAYESLLLQAYLFDALGGIFWWQWELNGVGGIHNFDYTPKDKPAEEIIRKYWKNYEKD